METKPRILYLLKILQERTDEEHQLSTNQLIEILNDEYGISTYRTTISKDVTALQQFGIDVVSVRSTQTRYFIGDRDFELAELKILIDAVESSKLITHKKSKELISWSIIYSQMTTISSPPFSPIMPKRLKSPLMRLV